MTRVVTTVAELRQAIGGSGVGLVPTMGALPAGHLALIERSAAENPLSVVSIFVNPTQFGDPADLARYPRDLKRDAALAAGAGADLIFAPDVGEIYGAGFATSVEIAGLTDRWEGVARPGHFRGVATVVTILLNAVRPTRAYFGEKDYQQLVIVRRLHRDLRLPGEIIGCPTVRADDGLALSSRNERLNAVDRRHAAVVPKTLFGIAAVATGEREVQSLLAPAQTEWRKVPGLSIDYLTVVNPDSLEPVTTVSPGDRLLIAVHLGPIRLIDNLALLSS